MKDILSRFTLESIQINTQTTSIAVVLWLTVLACAIWSINTQPFNKAARLGWIIAVIVVPLLGLLCYLPVAYMNASTGSLSFWRKPRK